MWVPPRRAPAQPRPTWPPPTLAQGVLVFGKPGSGPPQAFELYLLSPPLRNKLTATYYCIALSLGRLLFSCIACGFRLRGGTPPTSSCIAGVGLVAKTAPSAAGASDSVPIVSGFRFTHPYVLSDGRILCQKKYTTSVSEHAWWYKYRPYAPTEHEHENRPKYHSATPKTRLPTSLKQMAGYALRPCILPPSPAIGTYASNSITPWAGRPRVKSIPHPHADSPPERINLHGLLA